MSAAAEDAPSRLAQGRAFPPAGEFFGDRIQQGDPAGSVGRQHGVANAGQSDAEPFVLLAQGLPGLAMLVNFLGQVCIGLAKLGRARQHQFLQVITVMPQVGFGLEAPDIFLLEEAEDNRQQQKTQDAAGQQSLERPARPGVFRGDPLLQ